MRKKASFIFHFRHTGESRYPRPREARAMRAAPASGPRLAPGWGAGFVALLCLAAAPALAEPVEITAREAITWDRAAKTYTASGGVVAQKGTARVEGETLTARYADEKNAGDIKTITVAGRVAISSPPYTAHGQEGVYDVATGNAVLTGEGLRITTETEYLTARDKIEYFSGGGTLVASGEAVAVKGSQRLSADSLTAWFSKDADGKMKTDKITASGNIVITTANERITGDAGTYNVPAQSAELTGRVRIEQDGNFLEGTRATVDMTTGLSRLFADGTENGRVRGVFYPKKEQEGPLP